jgi:16S rRNA (adenine1518-N6/adenine1519-N6)-dimethyltransferase
MAKKTRRQLLGQHFLHEKNVLKKIVRVIEPGQDDLIVEIGPGKGALTFRLAAEAGRVVAVEKDLFLVQFLERDKPGNLEIIAGDILQIDLSGLIRNYKGKAKTVKLVGNLPYHISSQILFVLLKAKKHIDRAVFLFQKEMAERIVANPGSKKYAPLSILLQNFFDCRIVFLIKAGAFTPPPEVYSACVSFTRRLSPRFFPEAEEASFFDFLKACFSQRRKTLRRNLEGSVFRKEKLFPLYQKLGLDPKVRAENLEPGMLFAAFNLLTKTASGK